MHIKLYNKDKQNGGNKMFGLSTHEVEMKNVYAAFVNNISVYENLLRKYILEQDIETEELENDNMILSIKAYFEKSKDMLFNHLRTQYKNFDLKFEMIINNKEYSEHISNQDVYGIQAGSLFFLVCLAITKREPKPEMCLALNQSVRKLMDDVHLKIQKEINE